MEISEQILDLLQRMYVEGGDLHNKRGDILAFLHGVRPIEQSVALVKSGVEEVPELAGLVDVLPLYTILPQAKQDLALGKPVWMKDLEASEGYDSLSPDEQEAAARNALNGSRRRVVISTNVAETSLTVHGILHVVDCGIINQDAWDAQTQTKVISPVLHSRAGCRQRWGRAGRLMAGDAYCLYTKQQFANDFPGYSVPQILRAPLKQIVLTAKAAGIDDLEDFSWIDPPDTEELRRASVNLVEKKALDPDGDLTEHGLELQSFSEEPDLANMMLLADRFGCAIEMATLIPIMKLGGFSRLLKRERDWDANTRRSVRRIHRALIERSEDDIELCLKLYAAWSQSKDDDQLSDSWAFRQVWPNYLPSIGRQVKQQLGEATTKKLTSALLSATTPEELLEIISELEIQDEALDGWLAQASVAIANARPAAWARLFLVNHRALKTKIQVERDKLIDALSVHKKEDERRPIDFDLLTRLRIIFAYALPERIYELSDQVAGEGDRIYQPTAYVENQPTIPAVVGTYSICYQKDVEAFVCSKQQTIIRRLTRDSEPTQVMMVSSLAQIDPQWVPGILSYSPLELGHFIARETRAGRNGELHSTGAQTRLMIDQQYPLGSRYLCRVLESDSENRLSVEVEQRIASPPPVQEVYRSGEAARPAELDDTDEVGGELLVNTALEETDVVVLDPDYEMDPPWVDLAQEGRDTLDDKHACHACGTMNEMGGHYCTKCGVLLQEEQTNGRSVSTDTIQGWLISAGETYSPGTQLRADVVDYDLTDNDQPRTVLQPTPDPEPFFVFAQQFNVGDTISIPVIEHDTYPGDYLVALVVKEPQSGLEIVMEPSDLGFATRGFAVKAIPLGTPLQAVVESIDMEQHRVYLSCLPFVEDRLNKILAQKKTEDNFFEVNAVVGEVHSAQERVFLALEWSEPSQGLVYVTGIARRGLYKPADDHQIGETYRVQLRFQDNPSYKVLAKLPDEIEPLLGKQRGFKRLSWENGRLYFSGRMSYDLRNELQSPTKDRDYRRAIDDLYRFSNQPMADMPWPEDFVIKVGMRFPEAKVLRLASFGAFAEIKPGIDGLIHRSQMTWGDENPEDVVKVGELVDVRVITVDTEKRQIGLSMLDPQDNPLRKCNAGDRVSGKVTRLEDYGAFVKLKSGVTGLVHIKEMKQGYVSNIHDEVKVGDEVDVMILNVDLDRGRLSLSMKRA